MVGSARHRRRPARRPARRSAAVLGLVPAIVAIAVAGTLFAVSERLGDDVVRVPDPFAALDPATRPASTAATTFLLVGTDSRSAEPTTGADAAKQAFVAGVQRGDAALGVALRDGTPAAYAEQHPEAPLGPAPAGEEHP
jgi:hypothetical protein